jgi:16S rRNA (uracil1498-N3)-methyltransferase
VTVPLFLVDAASLSEQPVVVSGSDGRHAVDVRRIRVGERVRVGDGSGRLVEGSVAAIARGAMTVTAERRWSVESPQPRLVVVQALAKGGRDTDAVESMTEVGVDEIVPWSAARSVATWTDRVGDRWSATAREAAKQSRRAWVPTVAGCASTQGVVDRMATAALAVVLHESAETSLAGVDVPASGEVVLVVGPEGGITDEELAAFAAVGAPAYRLGGTVLRTSTAGVAALSVLLARTRWR